MPIARSCRSAAAVIAFAAALLLGAGVIRADTSPAPAIDSDVLVVKQRLLAQAPEKSATDAGVASNVASVQADGHWGDINYADRTYAGWAANEHLNRLLRMATAYNDASSKEYHDPALLKAFSGAYDYWTVNDFQNPNWWWNVIATPLAMSRLLLMMGPDLSAAQLVVGEKILDRVSLDKQAQENLVHVAMIAISRGCIEDKPNDVAVGFQRMADEIKITPLEGIQPDMSFHAHGPQLYAGGYGRDYSIDASRFALLASGTKFAFPQARIDVLTRYVLDGQQWMTRGKILDYSTLGRNIARKDANAWVLHDACTNLAQLDPARKAELDAFAQRLHGELAPGDAEDPVGNRHFWDSDYMVHRRSAYLVSVKMASTRTIGTESINDENLQGGHLFDGATFIYRTGREYHDIFPAWDWLRVPGTTWMDIGYPCPHSPRGLTSFVGGVSDGTYGVAALDLLKQIPSPNVGTLTGKKAWFCFDNEIVCLGAGITTATDQPVWTTVNQCLTHGSLGSSFPITAGTTAQPQTFHGPGWIQHDGVAYVFPSAADISLSNGTQTGSWKNINMGLGSAERVNLDVFKLWIEHGRHPTNGSYEYIIVPDVTKERKLDAYLPPAGNANESPVTVEANTARVQAVWDGPSAAGGAAFYAAGSATLASGLTVTVDQPCLVLARYLAGGHIELAVSNPENAALTVNVDVNRRLNGDGVAAGGPAGETRVRFELPGGTDAGRSVVRVLGVGAE